MNTTDTIAAIATPLADGAISIIRLSGEDAIPIAESIFDRPLAHKDSHTISYGFIVDEKGEPVDEVLVSLFKAPRTYTREDVVEINAHGGRFVTRKILTMLLENGARMARPGEFTQRAFLNGRIDLSQAEAVEDMVEASNDQAARMAISGIRGSIRRLLEPLIDTLLEIIANIEVNIDYPEYDDVEALTAQRLLPQAKELLARIDQLLQQSSRGQLFKKGIDTVIIGKPNVGKSSLLNALLEEDKAIVTDIAGTTRDIVEGQIHVGSLQLNLIDTAGIRTASDVIEQMGIEKSLQKLEEAQLVLLVLDGTRPLDEQDQALLDATAKKERIILINKQDDADFVIPEGFPEGIAISAAHNRLEPLFDALEERFAAGLLNEPVLLSNERQIGLLGTARKDLVRAMEAMEQGVEPDLIEIDLQEAYRHLKEIIGEVHQSDLLDTLFSRFCLGK